MPHACVEADPGPGHDDTPIMDHGRQSRVQKAITAPREAEVSYRSLSHKRQLATLMLARLAEPLAISSVQSYIFFQLQSFDPSASAATVSKQAGQIFSARTAAHVCTGVLWGRLADSQHGGRKLVLVTGLMTSAVATLGYGLSKSFATAITWQVVNGAFDATVSMVRCMTAELNPRKQHRARALTLLPLCANTGHLLGPLIGGFLAAPKSTESFHALIPGYPYAAPNIFVAALHLLAALAVVTYSEETLESAQCRKWNFLKWPRKSSNESKRLGTRESCETSSACAVDEQTSLLGVPKCSQGSNIGTGSLDPRVESVTDQTARRLPFQKLWASNVPSTMLAHFLISGHLGTFPSLWAIFLSTPLDVSKHQFPPFQFSGGLGMNPASVGIAMSFLGAIGIFMQIILYPTLNDRLGTVYLWRAALAIFPLTYFLAPFCALVIFQIAPGSQDSAYRVPGQAFVWIAVICILLLFLAGRTGVAPATTLIINDCAPHPSARATIHTTATVVSNLSRSIFPAVALTIFGVGLKIGIVGLGFWFIAGLAILACAASLWVVDESNPRKDNQEV